MSELCFATVLTAVAATTAVAGPALDDAAPAPAPAASEPTTSSSGATSTETPEAASSEKKTEYGIALRVRSVHVPKSILELFVERAADGASNVGLGVELSRRKGTVELQLGLEFEHLQVGEGVWINKGENVAAGDEADFILGPDNAPNGEQLGWFTIEFTFLNHAVINKYLSFRYGGGAGLGIITGGLYHYNVICVGATNNNVSPGCEPSNAKFSGTGVDSDGQGFSNPVKYDLPPVFPVVNAIIGLQIKPVDKLVINLETGIRTVPFIGLSTGYFF